MNIVFNFIIIALLNTYIEKPDNATADNIFKKCRENTNQVYDWGKNDCDAWVERILTECGLSIASIWKPANMNTVWQHYSYLKDKTLKSPKYGFNIFFQLWDKEKGYNHTGLVYLYKNGRVTAFHQGPNVLPNNRGEYGYSVELEFLSIKGFEEGLEKIWSGNSEFYYYPLKTSKK